MEAVARAGRRVDYIHVPVMPDATVGSPLRSAIFGSATRNYLGVVLGDGSDAFVRRAVDAGRYLPRFGIASDCGWGREDPDRVPALLADLPRVSRDLRHDGTWSSRALNRARRSS